MSAYRIPLSSLPPPNPSPEEPMTLRLVCENEKLLPILKSLLPTSPLNRN